MAICLDISAEDCRDALNYFVEADMVSFAGLDSEGIETWALTRTGYRVWAHGRVGCRVTKQSIKAFLAYMQVVIPALSKRPEVIRVVVSGAWVHSKTHGPFIIGICVKAGTTTVISEIQMIQEVLRIATAGDFLESDAPVVMIYSDQELPPESIQFFRIAYEQRQEAYLDLGNAPYASFDKCDSGDKGWDERLELYASELNIVPFEISIVQTMMKLTDRTADNGARDRKSSISTVPLARQLIERELDYCGMPAKGVDSPYVYIVRYQRSGISPPESFLAASEDYVQQMPRARGSFWAPDWQIAAATADYFWYFHMEDSFDAAAHAKKILKDGNWTISRYLHPLLKEAPAKAFQALAISLNESRTHKSLVKKAQEEERPKKPTVNGYYALFDVSLEHPRCVALVRQPTGNRGNLRNAMTEYQLTALRLRPDARAAYKAGFDLAQLSLMEREATPEEIEAFDRLSKQLKRSVAYIIDCRGGAIIGFTGRATTDGTSPLNFMALREGYLRPIVLEKWDFESIEEVRHALPLEVYKRIRAWWVVPDLTSAEEAAKACCEGPAISLLARVVNPDGMWTFQPMDGDSRYFAASMVGTGWAIRLENIGHKKVPPRAVCRFGNEVVSAQLKWRGDGYWRPKFTGSMPELTALLNAFRTLEGIGLDKAMRLLRPEDFGAGENPQVTSLQRFEAVLNLVVTGLMFYRDEAFVFDFDNSYAPSFGTKAMKDALADTD